jgi:putative DNA primase/helicase
MTSATAANKPTAMPRIEEWQVELAREAAAGFGIDAWRRILVEIREYYAADAEEADLLDAIQQITDCAYRNLTNESETINLIFDAVFPPNDDVNNNALDGIALNQDLEAEIQCLARLRPHDIKGFLQLEIRPRGMLLDPILPEKGLAMLYAARGTGKTLVALGIGYAVATGTKFLKWQAPKPRCVLLVDGEMPAATLQERIANLIAGAPDVELNSDNFKILAADLIEVGGIGNLASPEVQAELDQWLEKIDLLILDNLSSLTAVIRDNDAESWGPIQDWLLKLRRRGISVLIVHHAGKGGQQRGTSRREDVLDTSISLRRPQDYNPTEGARFEVHLEKARGVHGDAAKPFEAKLQTRDGVAVWTMQEIEDVELARVKALLDSELSVRDIAEETGISKSKVQRLKKKMEAEQRAEAGGNENDG